MPIDNNVSLLYNPLMISEEREMHILSDVVDVFLAWMETDGHVIDKRKALMELVVLLAVKYTKKEELVLAGMLMYFTLENWSEFVEKRKGTSFLRTLFGIEITRE